VRAVELGSWPLTLARRGTTLRNSEKRVQTKQSQPPVMTELGPVGNGTTSGTLICSGCLILISYMGSQYAAA
jgi:hypothetical protein